MNAVIMTQEEFDKLVQKISNIERKLDQVIPIMGNPDKQWLTIAETCKVLNISKRTLQKYRDGGMIPFAQVGSKIYFKQEDIQQFLGLHTVEAFSNKGGRHG